MVESACSVKSMALRKKLVVRQLNYLLQRRGVIGVATYLINVFNYLVINRYLRGSFSQKGEDLIIDKYFNHKRKGFYVDIGAFHPRRLNNTKFFYDKGWRGINVEPNPTRISSFKDERERDINLNIGIGIRSQISNFFEFEDSGLSTFSKKEAASLTKLGYKLKRIIKVKMKRLDIVFAKDGKRRIDFMTVDTEGLDMEVLKSNNWKRFRPKILVVETIDFIDILTNDKINVERKQKITKYLNSLGYREYYSNELNTVFEDTRL